MNIDEVIDLSNLLAGLAHVKRATKLPNGEFESDSHHSLSLALISYDIASKYCPELDTAKLLVFAMSHDLLEIITGDEDTLHYNPSELEAKRRREEQALHEFDRVFERYPVLKQAMYDYDKLDTPEAATIFVLDKACTTWTHFSDKAEYAKVARNLRSKQDITDWEQRQLAKIKLRLVVMPPAVIMDVYAESFRALRELYGE